MPYLLEVKSLIQRRVNNIDLFRRTGFLPANERRPVINQTVYDLVNAMKCLLFLSAALAVMAQPAPIARLKLHQPIERAFGPGQTDLFSVDVAAGQFLHVEAEQKGVDIIVAIVAPNGKVAVTTDSPN
jgi:hypothetical protein